MRFDFATIVEGTRAFSSMHPEPDSQDLSFVFRTSLQTESHANREKNIQNAKGQGMYESDVTEVESRIVVEFRGEISTINHADFRNDYNEICRRLSYSQNKQIILDLTQTTFFSSLFVGIIVKLSMDISRQGGVLVLCGLSDELKLLMQKLLLLERHSGFEDRLKHFPTREVAFASLATLA